MNNSNTKRKSNKTTPKSAESSADLDAIYSKLESLEGRQVATNNDFKPTMMALPSVQTPVSQGRLTGNQSYSNTPNTFIAPGYGQLKDLSIKRSNQAVHVSGTWDKAKANLINNLPEIDDPTFIQTRDEFLDAFNKYDEKLNSGDWADQATMVSGFVDEAINKKGGKQFANLSRSVAEREEYVKELVENYDSEKGVGGIDASEVDYASQRHFQPFIRNADGVIVGGGTYSFNKVYDKRNIPKELNDFMSEAKGNIKLGEVVQDEDGNPVQKYFSDTGILGKYGILSNKSYTEAEIKKAALAYLDSTNGDSYIGYQGKVREFNNPITADKYREVFNGLASQKEADPIYTELLSLNDEELEAKARKYGMGANIHASMLKENVLKGAVAVNEYNQETLAFVDDPSTLYRKELELNQEFGVKQGGDGNGSGNGSVEYDQYGNPILGPDNYHFTSTNISTYNAPDIEAPNRIAKRSADLSKELIAINNQLGALTTNDKQYNNSGKFKQLTDRKQAIDIEFKLIKDIQKRGLKELSDISVNETNIGLHSIIEIIKSQTVNGKKLGVDYDTAKYAIQSAIYSAANNDEEAVSSILKNAGLLEEYPLADNSVYQNGNKKAKGYIYKLSKSDYAPGSIQGGMLAGSGNAEIRTSNRVNQRFSLVDYVEKIGKSLATYKGGVDKDGKKVYDPMLEVSQNVFRLEGEASKNPAAVNYRSVLSDITTTVRNNMEAYKVLDMFGSGGLALDEYVAKEMSKKGIKMSTDEMTRYFEVGSVDLSSDNTFNSDKGLVYVANLKLKPVDKSKDPDGYAKATKLLDIVHNGMLNIPIQLGKNNHKDINVKNSLLAILKEKANVSTPIDEPSRQRILLALSNIEGISSAFDASYLYSLDGSAGSTRNHLDMVINNNTVKIQAIDRSFANTKEDKYFRVKVKVDGVYKQLAKNKEGKTIYATDDELAKDSSIMVKDFDTTEDLKAYFTEVKYRQEGKIGQQSFNKGGSKNDKYGTDRPSDKSTLYTNDLILNGKTFRTNSYVPKDQLVDIRGKMKIAGNAGIPFINKDIAPQAINIANQYGLTVTGGLRTKEHAVSDSAKRSSHFNGNSLDFAMDANGKKLYNTIKNNPNLAQKLGVQFVHGGNHVHITFNKPSTPAQARGSFNRNRAIQALAYGESSNNDNKGYHYKDIKSTSAYGKFGFQNEWIEKMASHYGKSADEIRKSPALIEQYAHTQYLVEARKEYVPLIPKLREKLERYIPNLSEEDVIFMFHYGGGNRLKKIANGSLSVNSIPAPKYNKQTIRQYVLNMRNKLR